GHDVEPDVGRPGLDEGIETAADLVLVADQGEILGVPQPLTVEHRAVGGHLPVSGQQLGRSGSSPVDVARDGYRDQGDHPWHRPAGLVGGRAEHRDDMFADGARTGHKGDGSGGPPTAQPEHLVAQGGDHERAWWRVRHVELAVEADRLAGYVNGLLFEGSLEKVEVLPLVSHRAVEGHLKYPFDDRAVHQADSEGEPSSGMEAGGQGLGGQRRWMAVIYSDDRRPELQLGG